ncbi:MAG: single-stranded DNA-binding protein [Rhodospirillaceae bacterium]|nr:single-stranded DNA-binding protein [Rhodospirillaceae bacterium]
MFAGREKRKFGRPVTRCKNELILGVSAPRGRNWRVANLSVATDESYINRQSGERVDKTEWHRVVTFQDGLIDMFEKHLG